MTKKILKTLFFISALFLLLGCNSDKEDGLNDFAQALVASITNEDSIAFRRFMPNDIEFDANDIENSFLSLNVFFKNKTIKSITFNSRFDTYNNENYAIIVFTQDSENNNDLNWKEIGKGWMEYILAVEVTYTEEGWKFLGTPFFMYRHAPWANDYGKIGFFNMTVG